MGKYKTLCRTQLQLFSTKLREYVKQWENVCAHCVPYTAWRTKKQELHFLGQSQSHLYNAYQHMVTWNSVMMRSGRGHIRGRSSGGGGAFS